MPEFGPLVLISHHLCPYVQRAAILLTEKGVYFERRIVDLSRKPDWFIKVSPLGKTPVLLVDGMPVFESAAILEFLEDTLPNPLHPEDPIRRAQHRGWIEFGSAILNDIARFYSAKDRLGFEASMSALTTKFERIEAELSVGPWFDGDRFTLVDTVFGPVFRYFDVFDQIGDFGILSAKPKVQAWRDRLSIRPSVRIAVDDSYEKRLQKFLLEREAHLSRLIDMNTQSKLAS